MGLSVIKRKVTRVQTVARTNEQNDLLLAVKKSGKEVKDMFRYSDKFFTESGLDKAENAATLAQDDATGKVYLLVVPSDSEYAEVSVARKTKAGVSDKTQEFQHKDAITILENKGQVATERSLGDYFGFDLVSSPDFVNELPGAIAAYEVVPATLVGRIASIASKGESTDSETSTPVATDSVIEDAPVAVEESEVEGDWDE